MSRRKTTTFVIVAFAAMVSIPNCLCQLLKSQQERKAGETSTTGWGDKAVAAQLSRNVTIGPRITAPRSGQSSNSAIIAALRRKRAAGQYTELVPVVQRSSSSGVSRNASAPGDAPGGGTPNPGPAPRGMLAGTAAIAPGDAPGGGRPNPGPAPGGMLTGNTTLLPPQPGSLGPAHTEAATGNSAFNGNPAGATSNLQSGPTKQQPPSQNRPVTNGMGKIPPHTAICLNPGISAVDNAKSGTVFSPGYSYKIQGCGFGATPGQINLTGIRNQNISNGGISQAPSPMHSDWVKLLPLPGKWSDSYIEAVVDPSASGFYDSPNATLRIITSDNRTLWSPAFGFFASRAQQTLASIPQGLRIYTPNGRTQPSLGGGSNFSPANVRDAAGQAVQANFLSPSAASVVLPGHTFAVVRDDNRASFPAGTDVLDLTSAIEPNGFEITSVQPFYANLPQQACPSRFSTDGNWNTLLTGIDKLNISFQEQSCGNNGVSAYAFDVIVEGPKGVSPF